MTACSGSEVNIFFSTSALEVKTSAYRVSARLKLFGHLVCDVVPVPLWHATVGSVPRFSTSWSEKTVLAWRTVTPPVSPELTRKRMREREREMIHRIVTWMW